VIDDALAIGGRVAHVEIRVVGGAAQVGAIRRATVEVADALMVAHKKDARTCCGLQPQGRRQVAGQVGQQPHELAVAAAVDPEVAGGAAAVALPARRVAGVAADHHLAGRAKGDGARRAYRRRPDRAVFRRAVDLVDGVLVAIEVARRAGKEDRLAVGGPAQHLAAVVEVGHALRHAAGRRHPVDLRRAFFAAHEGQPLAIGRERGIVHLAQVAGEPSRHAAAARHGPKVVLGDEDNGVLPDSRKSIIAWGVHPVVLFFGWRVARGELRVASCEGQEVQFHPLTLSLPHPLTPSFSHPATNPTAPPTHFPARCGRSPRSRACSPPRR
jgi:hypothetical protein